MTDSTQEARQYLKREDVRPHLERLVRSWNEHELLGIDLADDLRAMFAATGLTPNMLDQINWNELAEECAEEIVGVDEDELQRRLDSYGG